MDVERRRVMRKKHELMSLVAAAGLLLAERLAGTAAAGGAGTAPAGGSP